MGVAVTAADGRDAPARFVAVTLTVYEVPLVKPVTVQPAGVAAEQ